MFNIMINWYFIVMTIRFLLNSSKFAINLTLRITKLAYAVIECTLELSKKLILVSYNNPLTLITI